MKIVAPVSAAAEVGPLCDAGADEFYCGLVPRSWIERFGTAGANRRIFGNLASETELGEVVGLAHARRRRVSLVMNAPHYSEAQGEALLELAGAFAALGGDALIVGDIGVLALLAGQGPKLRLHVSSLLSCRNAQAAALYRDLGAHRVVLPRDLTPAEIAAMIAATPGIEFEAFILNDGCVFEEGQCHTIHLPSRLGGPICIDDYTVAHARLDGTALSEAEAADLAANDACYQQWLWCRFSCGFAVTDQGYPFGPCGLCRMPALAASGLTAAKIAGREGATARKAKSVEMVHDVRARMAAADHAAVAEFAQGLRGRPDLCASGFMCYYRDARATP
jgi:collagenase-like PrtC family protease